MRGGDQRIFTAGLNWYPNNVIRFAFNYELIQSSKLQSGSSQNALTGITATGTATSYRRSRPSMAARIFRPSPCAPSCLFNF